MNFLGLQSLVLAETGSVLSFSGFQQAFSEAWDFVFPNVVVLGLIWGIAKYIGGAEWLWFRTAWNKVRNSIASFAELLRSSNLPGAKLLPIAALLITVVLLLDVFQAFRAAAKNLLPPTVSVITPDLYEHLTHEPLMLRILLSPNSISSRWDLFRQIADWGDRVENDRDLPGSANVRYWTKNAGEWNSSAGDVKLLTLVALVSLCMGVRKGKARWRRFIVLLLALIAAYLFCTGKYLYASEQKGMAVVSSYERYLTESEKKDWDLFLQRGADNLQRNEHWLTQNIHPTREWWVLAWWDTWFYKSVWHAVWPQDEDGLVLLSQDALKTLREKIEAGKVPGKPADPLGKPDENRLPSAEPEPKKEQ